MKSQDFSTASPGADPTHAVVAEPVSSALVAPEFGALVESAKDYAAAARAEATRKAYAKQWTAFEAWCVQQGLCALPAAPQTVALRISGDVISCFTTT